MGIGFSILSVRFIYVKQALLIIERTFLVRTVYPLPVYGFSKFEFTGRREPVRTRPWTSCLERVSSALYNAVRARSHVKDRIRGSACRRRSGPIGAGRPLPAKTDWPCSSLSGPAITAKKMAGMGKIKIYLRDVISGSFPYLADYITPVK